MDTPAGKPPKYFNGTVINNKTRKETLSAMAILLKAGPVNCFNMPEN